MIRRSFACAYPWSYGYVVTYEEHSNNLKKCSEKRNTLYEIYFINFSEIDLSSSDLVFQQGGVGSGRSNIHCLIPKGKLLLVKERLLLLCEY